MLKKISIRKIAVTTSALFIITMLYFFPTKPESINLKQNVTYENNKKNAKVFLIDDKNYVSLVNVSLKNNDLNNKMIEAINILIDNNNKTLKKFKTVIPKNTKIKSLSIKNNIVTVNFSKEILNTKEEEKMIEAIVYTLTEFKDIKGVKILVENRKFNNKYNKILTRDIGINKEVNINSLKDLTYTTVYYLNNNDEITYYTPVTKVTNDKREKIAVIIDELKSSLVYQSNLSSFLNSNTELEKYKIEEKVMHLTFNEKIFDDFNNKNILEEVKYTIGKSVQDNYDVEKIVFYVGKEEIAKTVSKSLEN